MLVERALERVLHEVVCRVLVPGERSRIPPQARDVRSDRLEIHGFAALRYFAARQTLLKPSPVLSPGFWSLTQK